MKLNLTCQIHFGDIFNVTPIVSVSWRKEGLDLVSNDQISLEIAAQVSPGIHEQNLVFNSLQLGAQGNYSCDSIVSVSVQDFQSQVSGSPAFYAFAIEGKFIFLV